MLQGEGGRSIPPYSNGMQVARIECHSCHRFKEVSATGTVLWKASAEVCITCHDPSAADRLDSYRETLGASLDDVEAGIRSARQALEAASPDVEQSTDLAARLDDLEHDLNFLRAANGIHNIHYASSLLRAMVDRLSSVCRELKIAEPEVELPESLEAFK